MSNYSQTTFFTPKDTLPTSDPNKTIFGAAHDVELGNISTAITSKYDATNAAGVLAYLAQANVFTLVNSFAGVTVTGSTIPANGIYLSAANTLTFASNTTLRGTVNSTGNWSLAAPSSGTTLSLTAIASSNAISVSDGTSTGIWQPAGAGATYFGTSSAHGLNLGTGGSPRLQINSAGNITVNAATSGVTISVAGGGNSPGLGVTGSAGQAAIFTVAGNAGGFATGLALYQDGTQAGYINQIANQPFSVYTNNTLRTTWAAAGNVTINAPSSGATLTVNTAGSNVVVATIGGLSVSNGAVFAGGTTELVSTPALNIGTNAAVAVGFWTNSAQRVSIGSAGNVTITAPASGTALTVNGLAAAGNSASFVNGSTVILFQGTSAGTNGFGTNTAHDFSLVANGVNRLTLSTAGNVTINAPTSGAAATITAFAGSAGLVVNGSAYTPTNAIGNSSTAFTVDCSKSNSHTVTMNGNVAAGSMTISNLQDGQTVNLKLTQDGTGTRTLGNATGVKWPGGTVGVLSTAIGAVDILTLWNSGGTIYASLQKAFA